MLLVTVLVMQKQEDTSGSLTSQTSLELALEVRDPVLQNKVDGVQRMTA